MHYNINIMSTWMLVIPCIIDVAYSMCENWSLWFINDVNVMNSSECILHFI